MTVTGLEQGDPHASLWASAWFDAGFAVVIFGIALVVMAMFVHFHRDTPSTFKPVHSLAASPPSSLTWGNVRISGKSNVQVDSSAERYADEGTEITGEARVSGRHFPGHPGLLTARSDDEQGRKA